MVFFNDVWSFFTKVEANFIFKFPQFLFSLFPYIFARLVFSYEESSIKLYKFLKINFFYSVFTTCIEKF